MKLNNLISRLISRTLLYYSHLNAVVKQNNPKIKLVAIAKDEAAYLSEWIFHHLHFGFHHIVVYINNTTDNSMQIVRKFADDHRVEFKNGDSYFRQTDRAPQMAIYLDELRASRAQGYTHAMFLDIDEFYTPRDFDLSISDFIRSSAKADVYCFEWLHKLDENKQFGEPFDNSLVGRRAPQVKSMLAITAEPYAANPHNFLVKNSTYRLADGAIFDIDPTSFHSVDFSETEKPLKRVFILHRMTRSQLEYVAALKRGRPFHDGRKSSIFKDNRSGMFSSDNNELVKFPADKIQYYLFRKEIFLHKYQLHEEIEVARKLVVQRYSDVLKMIRTAPIEESDTLKKILQNIDLQEVEKAYQYFINKCNE